MKRLLASSLTSGKLTDAERSELACVVVLPFAKMDELSESRQGSARAELRSA
jgi:hypothetical protein